MVFDNLYMYGSFVTLDLVGLLCDVDCSQNQGSHLGVFLDLCQDGLVGCLILQFICWMMQSHLVNLQEYLIQNLFHVISILELFNCLNIVFL